MFTLNIAPSLETIIATDDLEPLALTFGEPTDADLRAIEQEEREEAQKALLVDMPKVAPATGSMDQLVAVLTGEVKPVDNKAVASCLDELRFAVHTYVQTPDGSPEDQDWWDIFQRRLTSMGFTLLGVGYFSAVFSQDDCPELAFKVGFKKEDSGAAYAAFCRNYQSNAKAGRYGYSKDIAQHLPEILHIERQEKCYLVVMPKYEPLEVSSDVTESIRNTAYQANLGYSTVAPMSPFAGSEPLNTLSSLLTGGEEAWEESPKQLRELHEVLLQVYNSNLDHVDTAFSILTDYRSMVLNTNTVAVVQLIREFFSGVASFDLHGENAMVNTQGGRKVLVLTDPVSFSKL